MPYSIEIADVAFDELQAIKVFERRKITQAIDEQLTHEPTNETRNRKLLAGIQPNFEHEPPVWELRVDEHRVYYDVNEELKRFRLGPSDESRRTQLRSKLYEIRGSWSVRREC